MNWLEAQYQEAEEIKLNKNRIPVSPPGIIGLERFQKNEDNVISSAPGKKRIFDDEAAKETSDVTLIVKDRRFHVSKMYLAAHSTYFKSLILGKFSESGKTEIELKEIDPNDFQHFLEFLYAESEIEAHSVLGILHLANFSDSKTVIRKCQEFLMKKSKLSLQQKFETAIKYNLNELKKKCISEIQSPTDLKSMVSENAKFDNDVWHELFSKAISFTRRY